MTRPAFVTAGKKFIHYGLGVLAGGVLAGSFLAVGTGLTMLALGQLVIYCAMLKLS